MIDFADSMILAIDSSSNYLKLGLRYGSDRQVIKNDLMEKSHGQLIMKKIDDLFVSTGVDKKDLAAIVVCTGPGSFTGLRIGIAASKGIAVALDLQVVGINLFEIAGVKLPQSNLQTYFAVPFKRDALFVVPVEAGQCDINRIKVMSIPELIELTQDENSIVYGTGLTQLSAGLGEARVHSFEYEASQLLYLGIEKLMAGKADDLNSLEPLYLQKSQAEIRFEQNRQ